MPEGFDTNRRRGDLPFPVQGAPASFPARAPRFAGGGAGAGTTAALFRSRRRAALRLPLDMGARTQGVLAQSSGSRRALGVQSSIERTPSEVVAGIAAVVALMLLN